MSHQLKDIPMVQHASKDLNWRFLRSFQQLRIYLFPTAVFFLWIVETNMAFEKSDIITPKTKWLSFDDSLSFIWRFTPSIPLKYINPNNASISALSAFLTHVNLLDLFKLSLRYKRAIVSFILVFVQSTTLFIISLSKYKWKVSLMFSILLPLEFRTRQLILPEMVSHFRCLPVATGRSELYQIFFVFLSFFGPR